MYVESVAEKVRTALKANAIVPHTVLVDTFSHPERVGWYETIVEMERRGEVKRQLIRNEQGKLVLHYIRVIT